MKKSTSGFTIVELLIVIVVIGILAAIVIVAFNGVQTRATFAKLNADLRSIDKTLAVYYGENGSYPIPSGGPTAWVYSCQSGITNFIPELNAITPLPQAPCNSSATSDTWLYRSNGTDYKLMQIRGDTSLLSQIPAALQDQNARFGEPTNARTWGYWSAGGATW